MENRMPIYEYQCTKCEHKLEALQKFSDDLLKDCPACKQPKLRKLVSAASFRLKGSGWYETDFKTGDKKQLADSPSDAKADKQSSGDSSDKTESKGKENAGETKRADGSGKTDSSSGKDGGKTQTSSGKSTSGKSSEKNS